MTPAPPSSPFPGGSRPGGSGPPGDPSLTPSATGFIGRYQILEKIGEGGMGSLYLARDPAIDRLVAIKLLRRGFDTEAVRERFAREARAAGRLRHPNIVTIFDVGEHDGDPFIAMEFLAGETLGELIRHRAGLSLSRRLKLLEELCDGLSYAHRAGLVHRDIKPANLMVDAEGVLKILDFGIVRVGESGMTQAGVLVGTINYMSPEQVLGTAVDHRSDIFAVGLVAYELLTGRQAFPGTMKDGLLRRIPNAEIEPLPSLLPNLDPEVVAIVEHALQKNAADRYQELARMRNDLARVRQRIEVEEERQAIEAASASAETALIAEAPTELATPIEPQRRSGIDPIVDAERALAQGNYRAALSMAGRAAALNPLDRNPSSIVARAEQALLERGRSDEGGLAATPRSGMSGAGSGGPPLPASSPSQAPAPPSGVQSGSFAAQRANYLAIAVAVLALAVAAFAVLSQLNRIGPGADETPRDASNVPSRTGEAPTAAVTEGQAPPSTTGVPVESGGPAGSASEPAGSGATPARDTQNDSVSRNARQDRTRQREERQPPQRSKTAPTPGSGPPPPPAAGRTEPPAPSLPSTGSARPPANLPGTEIRPGAPAPPAPKLAPKPEPPKADVTPRSDSPPRDPVAEARTAVAAVLERYEAAWEALDFDALSKVWAMPDPRGVRASIRDMREYAMNVSVDEVSVAPDARSAAAVCTITYRFQGAVSGRQEFTRTQTFRFEQRGGNWMIVGPIS